MTTVDPQAILVQDRSLPSLSEALEREPVERILASLFGRTQPGVRATALRRQETRYEPGMRCTVVWELTIEDRDGRTTPTIGVVDALPAGITARGYVDDPDLGALASVTDHAVMSSRLVDDAVIGPDAHVRAIEPVRYKPGRSCVVRYVVDSDGAARTLYAKIVPDSRPLARTLAQLGAARSAAPALPRVPVTLAHWDDLGLILQPEIRGQTLGNVLFAPATPDLERARLMTAAGAAIAHLHSQAGPLGPRRTPRDDLAELTSFSPHLEHLAPTLAPMFARGLDRRADDLSAQPTAPAVPSHGALRTDQLVVDATGLVTLDWDGFCWADPARDIGNLLAYLEWRAIRRPADRVVADAAGHAFIEGYADVRTLPPEPALRAARTTSALKIVGRRLAGLTVDEWRLLPELLATID